MRNIRVLISFEVDDTATDEDINVLVGQAVAQFDDPRDADGDHVAFDTRLIGEEWEVA